MKTRNLLIFILLVGALTVGVYFNSKKEKPTEVIERPEEKPALVIDTSLILEKSSNQASDYAAFNVKFPQFENVPSEFNQKIEQLVSDAMKEHLTISEANWKARAETDESVSDLPKEDEKFQLDISWTPTQVNAKYISVILTIGGYTGGAHGYQNLVSFNYDVINKKEITLADLLANDKNYLKTISDLSRTTLRKKFGTNTNEDMLMAGTEATKENFSVFTFTDKEITLYFTQYQVAPYAMGESTVKFPR